MTMLEYSKKVLKGVHNHKFLFRKELIKLLKWLNPEEQKKLFNWVLINFKKEHPDVIQEIFQLNYKLA